MKTFIFHLLLLVPTYGQLISPCPNLFSYDTQRSERGKLYATVTLKSDAELSGVWLRLIFDKPSIQLGNWFGEVVTTDNKEYLIKNRNHKLQPNQPYRLNFFVQYDVNEDPPQLLQFRLNAKTVCPEGATTTEASVNEGQLLTSSILSTTGRPINKEDANGNSFGEATTEEEFFGGDFSNRPTKRPSASNSPGCGQVTSKATPLISHGTSTSPGQWPWHVALYYIQEAHQLVYTCGATLISEDHIITAAHCVTKPKTKNPINVRNLAIYLGKYSLKKFGAESQHRDVSHIYVHPEYNSTRFFNDIAVLKLRESADFTDFVRPCCLWEEGTDINRVINKSGTVVGWGFDENREISDKLIQAKMPVVSTIKCIYSNPEFFSRFTFEKNFCAGFRNGTTVCNGDSGGSMVFPKTGTSGRNTVWQLRGIVSLSVALQDQGVCDPEHYVIFTDVAQHLDWIKRTMNR